jgi:hypothetical protein
MTDSHSPVKKKKKTEAEKDPVFSDTNLPCEIRAELQFNEESGEFSSTTEPEAGSSTQDK